jgi:hypothetical protein
MRPNTPHVVFTAEHSVCFGGHFYATSTLRDTCYGMFHTFVAGSIMTNAQHTKNAFMLLSRLIAFFESHFLGSNNIHSELDLDDDSGMLCFFIITNIFLIISLKYRST